MTRVRGRVVRLGAFASACVFAVAPATVGTAAAATAPPAAAPTATAPAAATTTPATAAATATAPAAPAPAAATTAPDPTDDPEVDPALRPTWTAEEAIAALEKSTIARVEGAPAVVDTEAVQAALAGTPYKVLLLPYVGLDTNSRRPYHDEVNKVEAAVEPELIVVQGLQATFSYYEIAPDTLGDFAPVLAHNDVTAQVVFAIEQQLEDDTGKVSPDRPDLRYPPPTVPVAPQQLEVVATALETKQAYSDPSLEPLRPDARWNLPGSAAIVRIAQFPALDRKELLPNFTEPLGKRFPDDVVIVIHGHWVEISAPKFPLARTSLLWMYGTYGSFVIGRQVEPPVLAMHVVEKLGELSNQGLLPIPQVDDPVPWTKRVLPWVFAGVVLVLAPAAIITSMVRNSRRQARQQAADRLTRQRLAGELAAIGADLLRLDDLAQRGEVSDLVTAAAERYRAAVEQVRKGGNLAVATEAAGAARTLLAKATALRGTRGALA